MVHLHGSSTFLSLVLSLSFSLSCSLPLVLALARSLSCARSLLRYLSLSLPFSPFLYLSLVCLSLSLSFSAPTLFLTLGDTTRMWPVHKWHTRQFGWAWWCAPDTSLSRSRWYDPYTNDERGSVARLWWCAHDTSVSHVWTRLIHVWQALNHMSCTRQYALVWWCACDIFDSNVYTWLIHVWRDVFIGDVRGSGAGLGRAHFKIAPSEMGGGSRIRYHTNAYGMSIHHIIYRHLIRECVMPTHRVLCIGSKIYGWGYSNLLMRHVWHRNQRNQPCHT